MRLESIIRRINIFDWLVYWKQQRSLQKLLVCLTQSSLSSQSNSKSRTSRTRNYSSYIPLNFIINKDDSRIFGDNLQADALFASISALHPDFRLIPGDTLIFLDEIQSCPRARTALKSLAIDGRADIIASGSLLGLTFLDDGHQKERAQESIPVGYKTCRHASA